MTFIERGFAWHKPGTKDTMLDEPLAILAAFHCLNKNASFSLFGCLHHDIKRHSACNNGIKAYLCHALN